MNAVNGLLVALAALASIAVGVAVLLALSGTLPPQAVPVPVLSQQLAVVTEHTGGLWWRDVGVAIGLLAAGLVILALEVRLLTGTASSGMVLLSSESGGTVRMSLHSIAQLAQRTAQSNRDVRSVRCRIRVTPGGISVHCVAGLRMASDVPAVTSDIQENIREVIERLTGLTVTDVSVRARYQGDRDQPVLTR